MSPSSLALLTFNIGNPSTARAERQLAWLAGRDEHVLVLTETKASAGCELLADAFTAAGHTVTYSKPEPGEYGVMIISRVETLPDDFGDRLPYLPARAAATVLPTAVGPIRVIGAYVPSRDASPEKTQRKQQWLRACRAALIDAGDHVPTVLLGDLNVLEPDHQPHYRFFAPFEYDFYQALHDQHGLVDAFRCLHPHAIEHSWVGRTGDGYRYDHAFCSRVLQDRIAGCDYIHTPRQGRLSDHSALTICLAVVPPPALPTSDPIATTAPDTLF
jgi:exodeoxyribonuclease III